MKNLNVINLEEEMELEIQQRIPCDLDYCLADCFTFVGGMCDAHYSFFL